MSTDTPIIPEPLVIGHQPLSHDENAAMRSLLQSVPSHNSTQTLGVIFVGNRHWQPIVISPHNQSISIWDVPGPFQSLSRVALMTAMPDWTIVAETLPPYPDGDCGVVAIEVLLAASQGRDWSKLTSHDLQHRRALIAQSHRVMTHRFIGGSSQPTDDFNDNTTDWTSAVDTLNDLHHSHTVIGTLEGADIRMASLNINGLADPKLPFLAWLFTKFKLDFLALQDTRIAHANWDYTKNAAAEIFPVNTLFLHSPPMALETAGPTSLIGGVAIFVSERCCKSPNFRHDPLKCGAICGYSFATSLGRLLVISTYFPNKATTLPGSLWSKISSVMPNNTQHTPLQFLMETADEWSALEEASAETFLLGDLNASIGPNAHGGCHNIQN